MTINPIHKNSPFAESTRAIFRGWSDRQRDQQDAVGFGKEGRELRLAVDTAKRSVEYWRVFADGSPEIRLVQARQHLETAEGNLRNYILAKLALIMTEASEAIEEIRDGHAIDETYYNEPLAEIDDGMPYAPAELDHLRHFTPRKPEGVPSELADVMIRVFSLCGEFDIDIANAVLEKANYNTTRAQMHGGKVI